MNRTDIINYLIRRCGYRRYLEIGVGDPTLNFDRVIAAEKHGVDPSPRGPCTYRMTSDAFFATIDGADHPPYDIVFIDGLHVAAQVLRDVDNSLRHLAPHGVIVLHDCDPSNEADQVEERGDRRSWTGTVWKAFAKLRMTRSDLCMATIATDCGVGIVARGKQKLLPWVPDEGLTYGFFVANRRKLLNLFARDEFPALVEQIVRHGRARYGRFPVRRAAQSVRLARRALRAFRPRRSWARRSPASGSREG